MNKLNQRIAEVEKDPLDKLFVDKIIKCSYCDKHLGTIKNRHYKYFQKVFRERNGRFRRIFCSENCKINYNQIIDRLIKIEKRLERLE